jgi:hypothetical protein
MPGRIVLFPVWQREIEEDSYQNSLLYERNEEAVKERGRQNPHETDSDDGCASLWTIPQAFSQLVAQRNATSSQFVGGLASKGKTGAFRKTCGGRCKERGRAEPLVQAEHFAAPTFVFDE